MKNNVPRDTTTIPSATIMKSMFDAQALLHDAKSSVTIDSARVVSLCNAFLDLVNDYNRLRMLLPCQSEKK